MTPTAELAEVGIGTRLRDPERTAHIQMSESVKSVSLANGSASRATIFAKCSSMFFLEIYGHVYSCKYMALCEFFEFIFQTRTRQKAK